MGWATETPTAKAYPLKICGYTGEGEAKAEMNILLQE